MFPSWWADRFGQTPPLGYRLRVAFPDRWLRIHSLPESKRYAEDAEELELLLQRHATIANEVVAGDPSCWILVPTYHERAAVGTRRLLPDMGTEHFECFATIEGDKDESDMGLSFWVRSAPWEFEAERSLLTGIANDELRAVWVGQQSGEVFAPYYGGIDLILASTERRDMLRDRYRAWLSTLPSGL